MSRGIIFTSFYEKSVVAVTAVVVKIISECGREGSGVGDGISKSKSPNGKDKSSDVSMTATRFHATNQPSDGRSDVRTDGRMDKFSYRDAKTHLKKTK